MSYFSVHCLFPSMFYISCSTFNGMYCSCYCCLVIVVNYLPYCVLSLFASHPGFLSIVSVRICRIVSSHVSLYARVILFSSQPLRPRLSISRCSSVGTEVTQNFSRPPRLREIHASCSRGSFQVDCQSISREDPFQSIDHQRPLKSQCKFTESTP